MLGKESNAHYYSKIVIREWFRKRILDGPKGPMRKYFIFEWEPDFSNDDLGLKLEYPILSKGKQLLGLQPAWTTLPSMTDLEKNNLTVEVIFDFAVISRAHKLEFALEVDYKHPCSDKKIDFITKNDIVVYEISAFWIMNQLYDRVPNSLILKTIG
jgi:hypothetical protein